MDQRTLSATRRSGAAGFTLIELMVVIVILGVLAGLVLPRIVDQPDKARVVKAKMQIESLSMALKQYKLDNGFYPTTEQGLRALKEKPSIGRVPQNYPAKGYVDTVPKDPWSRDYVYICPGEHGDFDLISLGADQEEGGEGVNADIKSWDLGG
ncbi:type II secretion system major pseudopilin GspG [Solidesulfovibrio sp.]|uniref:type II secretion system major pseudopilin GspG n=1 Tax=Solidesulfovibrio sp. TaxID=2910990 RepID=UPI0026248265|nr:type II secretion system major pseudopilin GspG [Solidesulfovibrio sp.]